MGIFRVSRASRNSWSLGEVAGFIKLHDRHTYLASVEVAVVRTSNRECKSHDVTLERS